MTELKEVFPGCFVQQGFYEDIPAKEFFNEGKPMKQLTFPKPTTCTHIYPDGKEERVRYGQFEAILISTENSWPVNRTKILIMPQYLVSEVVKEDGTKVIFDEPFYTIEIKEYGDESGRQAVSIHNKKNLL